MKGMSGLPKTEKFFSTLIWIFKDGSRSNKTRFIDMPGVNIGTWRNLFYAIPSITSVYTCIIHTVDSFIYICTCIFCIYGFEKTIEILCII